MFKHFIYGLQISGEMEGAPAQHAVDETHDGEEGVFREWNSSEGCSRLRRQIVPQGLDLSRPRLRKVSRVEAGSNPAATDGTVVLCFVPTL